MSIRIPGVCCSKVLGGLASRYEVQRRTLSHLPSSLAYQYTAAPQAVYDGRDTHARLQKALRELGSSSKTAERGTQRGSCARYDRYRNWNFESDGGQGSTLCEGTELLRVFLLLSSGAMIADSRLRHFRLIRAKEP